MDWWTKVCNNTDFVEKVYFPKSEKRKLQWNSLIDEIASLISSDRNTRILELCCGTCAVGVGLAARGYTVTGVDLSESMLAYARRRADENNVKVDYLVMDAMDIQTLNRNFDVVLLLDMAFGFIGEIKADDKKLLQGIRKVLGKDGIFIVEINNPEYYKEKGEFKMDGGSFRFSYKFNAYENTLVSEASVDGVGEIWKGVGRVYSRNEIGNLFASAGFPKLTDAPFTKAKARSDNPSYMLLCE